MNDRDRNTPSSPSQEPTSRLRDRDVLDPIERELEDRVWLTEAGQAILDEKSRSAKSGTWVPTSEGSALRLGGRNWVILPSGEIMKLAQRGMSSSDARRFTRLLVVTGVSAGLLFLNSPVVTALAFLATFACAGDFLYRAVTAPVYDVEAPRDPDELAPILRDVRQLLQPPPPPRPRPAWKRATFGKRAHKYACPWTEVVHAIQASYEASAWHRSKTGRAGASP